MPNERIKCKDGFEMSVQANASAYCSPRMDTALEYWKAEVGFPSEAEDLLLEYAEDATNPTGTVYGWVPRQVVTNVIAKHGGIVSGDLPRGFPYLSANKP